MRKTNIVIFSSGISEKNGTLNKVIEGLKAKEYDVFCWRDLFKDAHESTNIALLPMLIKKIPTFDFAILIGESHDATTLLRKGNKVQVNSMRDNVVFEIGLSVMALGLKRVILLTDQSVRLPEDLTGLHGELATIISLLRGISRAKMTDGRSSSEIVVFCDFCRHSATGSCNVLIINVFFSWQMCGSVAAMGFITAFS